MQFSDRSRLSFQGKRVEFYRYIPDPIQRGAECVHMTRCGCSDKRLEMIAFER